MADMITRRKMRGHLLCVDREVSNQRAGSQPFYLLQSCSTTAAAIGAQDLDLGKLVKLILAVSTWNRRMVHGDPSREAENSPVRLTGQ